MSRRRIACLAVVLGVGLAPGAWASPPPPSRGPGCHFLVVNDTTPDGLLGGQNQWNGVIVAALVSTDRNGIPDGAPISVECELLINGNSQGVVLAAAGPGAAVGGSQFSFTAEYTDVVHLCTYVNYRLRNCVTALTSPLVPHAALAAVRSLVTDLRDILAPLVDATVCAVTPFLAPGVSGVGDVTPEGDVWVVGEQVVDCAPYNGNQSGFDPGYVMTTLYATATSPGPAIPM